MNAKNTGLRKDFTIVCRGKLISLSRPLVMGIINVTDDSFYEGSRTRELHGIVARAGEMLQDGASILDIGAQSTRPGAPETGADEELRRLLPAIHALVHHYPEAILSVDTYHAEVARQCVLAGAAIVNDVSAGEMDEKMLPVVASLQVPYIAMHMQGTPATMQKDPQYSHVTREVLDYFVQKAAACRRHGIHDLIIDPGFGFGKTLAHNYQLLDELHVLHMAGAPLLIGASRKSMIWKLLDVTAADALNGTTVIHTLALQQGVSILRAHDVKAAMEAIKIVEYMRGAAE